MKAIKKPLPFSLWLGAETGGTHLCTPALRDAQGADTNMDYLIKFSQPLEAGTASLMTRETRLIFVKGNVDSKMQGQDLN